MCIASFLLQFTAPQPAYIVYRAAWAIYWVSVFIMDWAQGCDNKVGGCSQFYREWFTFLTNLSYTFLMITSVLKLTSASKSKFSDLHLHDLQ